MRLTRRFEEDGVKAVWCRSINDTFLEGESGYEEAEKLAAYEEAEEQGLLIRLQYPLGTELYFPFKCQGVIKDRIRRWQLNKKGLFFCSYAGNAYRPEAIGKTVFLTKEEAEAALERMGEDGF